MNINKEVIKVQLGKILMNKTYKYLLPSLNYYGDDFAQRYHTIWKVAVGIADIVTIKSDIIYEKHIFMLIDVDRNLDTFNSFLPWVKEQEMYQDDYAFDKLTKGNLHMIVIKLPEKFYNAMDCFRKNEFSKMYSKEDIEHYFHGKPEVVGVLVKDHNYKLQFTEKVQEAFGVKLKIEEVNDSFELELPIDTLEIFNDKYLKQ